jgi:hypothetical protein
LGLEGEEAAAKLQNLKPAAMRVKVCGKFGKRKLPVLARNKAVNILGWGGHGFQG